MLSKEDKTELRKVARALVKRPLESEIVKRLYFERELLREAESSLREVMNCLGPDPASKCRDNKCLGCEAERGHALVTVMAALDVIKDKLKGDVVL